MTQPESFFRSFFRGSFLLLPLVITAVTALGQDNSVSPTGNRYIDVDDVVRIETNVVTVPAVIMDRDGRYVTDLRKGDFQILEDGVEQEIASFTPVEHPFTLFLVLDLSSSMTLHTENLSRAVKAFVELLHPDDQLTVVAFYQNESSVDTLIPATRASELRREIKFKFRVDGDCYTRIYDVVDDSLNRIKKVPGRKAMVLLSDGEGIGILATSKGTLHKAEEQDAPIYTVQFGALHGPPRFGVSPRLYWKQIEETNGYLRGLAEKTGGRYYQVEAMANTEPFGQIAAELRRQYNLSYYPKKPLEVGQTRQIRVKVRVPNLVVRSRDSYTVAAVSARSK